MKKIINPYDKTPGYFCFGCSHNNPFGLHMDFYEDGEEVVSVWDPQERFQGYHNILHGGIQATLMDEAASWLVYSRMKISGVTSKLDIKYKRPVPTDKGAIKVRAKLREMKRNLAFIHVQLTDAEGNLCAEADAVFYTYTREYSIKHLGLPEDSE